MLNWRLLEVAQTHGHQHLVDYLIQHGADIHAISPQTQNLPEPQRIPYINTIHLLAHKLPSAIVKDHMAPFLPAPPVKESDYPMQRQRTQLHRMAALGQWRTLRAAIVGKGMYETNAPRYSDYFHAIALKKGFEFPGEIITKRIMKYNISHFDSAKQYFEQLGYTLKTKEELQGDFKNLKEMEFHVGGDDGFRHIRVRVGKPEEGHILDIDLGESRDDGGRQKIVNNLCSFWPEVVPIPIVPIPIDQTLSQMELIEMATQKFDWDKGELIADEAGNEYFQMMLGSRHNDLGISHQIYQGSLIGLLSCSLKKASFTHRSDPFHGGIGVRRPDATAGAGGGAAAAGGGARPSEDGWMGAKDLTRIKEIGAKTFEQLLQWYAQPSETSELAAQKADRLIDGLRWMYDASQMETNKDTGRPEAGGADQSKAGAALQEPITRVLTLLTDNMRQYPEAYKLGKVLSILAFLMPDSPLSFVRKEHYYDPNPVNTAQFFCQEQVVAGDRKGFTPGSINRFLDMTRQITKIDPATGELTLMLPESFNDTAKGILLALIKQECVNHASAYDFDCHSHFFKDYAAFEHNTFNSMGITEPSLQEKQTLFRHYADKNPDVIKKVETSMHWKVLIVEEETMIVEEETMQELIVTKIKESVAGRDIKDVIQGSGESHRFETIYQAYKRDRDAEETAIKHGALLSDIVAAAKKDLAQSSAESSEDMKKGILKNISSSTTLFSIDKHQSQEKVKLAFQFADQNPDSATARAVRSVIEKYGLHSVFYPKEEGLEAQAQGRLSGLEGGGDGNAAANSGAEGEAGAGGRLGAGFGRS